MSGIIVGLDIGTSNIRVVIGQLDENNNLEVIGVSQKPSRGVSKGVIRNIDDAVAAIRETIEAAELMAGVEIASVFTAIGGEQVEGRSSTGGVAVDTTKKNRSLEISMDTKQRARDAASAVVLPLGKDILHLITQEYKVDEVADFKDPIGIQGVRLDVSVYIVSASRTACSNIEQCIKHLGYMVDGIMLKTLAAAYATLHEEEMELGSILIDLGTETTDVMVIYKGATIYITSVPVGMKFVTNDIAQVKGIPFADAEEIKIGNGCCWAESSDMEEEVLIREIGARPAEQTTRYELCQIIQPRMVEIMTLVKKEVVRHSGLKTLNGSIVLTGGGALMPGVVQLAQAIWHTTSVRVGECANLGDADGDGAHAGSYRRADFATAVGLLVLANSKGDSNTERARRKPKAAAVRKPEGEPVGKKIKDLFGKFF